MNQLLPKFELLCTRYITRSLSLMESCDFLLLLYIMLMRHFLRSLFFFVQAVLQDILDKFLPDDVHIRSNGRVRGNTGCVQHISYFCHGTACAKNNIGNSSFIF